MTLRTNYHTHSRYCDGEGEIRQYIEAAIAAGLDSYGVSSHAPLPMPMRDPWMMRLDDLPAYCAEVRALRDEYRDRLAIFLALELDYVPGLDAYLPASRSSRINFDYFVGSVHFVGTDGEGMPWEIDESAERFAAGLAGGWDGDVRRAFERYFALQRAMVGTPGVAIVGHMDKMKMWNFGDRYFRESDPWYVAAVEETLARLQVGRVDRRTEYLGAAEGDQRAVPQPVGTCSLPRSGHPDHRHRRHASPRRCRRRIHRGRRHPPRSRHHPRRRPRRRPMGAPPDDLRAGPDRQALGYGPMRSS